MRRWDRTVAQVRGVHGTARRQVYAHFLEVEKPALQLLPESPFQLFVGEVEKGTRHKTLLCQMMPAGVLIGGSVLWRWLRSPFT